MKRIRLDEALLLANDALYEKLVGTDHGPEDLKHARMIEAAMQKIGAELRSYGYKTKDVIVTTTLGEFTVPSAAR